MTAGQANGVTYGHDGEYAFCAAQVPAAASYGSDVRDAYITAFETAANLGYPHVFRMWNLVGRIDQANADGLAAYQDFCRGRGVAFDKLALPYVRLPAATTVGTLDDGVTFYLLARRSTGHLAVENTRQIPGYRYPERHGSRPPLLTRAAFLPDENLLLISGTASIVGHRTAHAHDLPAQCRTTFGNLASLTGRDNLRRHAVINLHDTGSIEFHVVKVYVRHQADVEYVRHRCHIAFGETTDIGFVVTDLCRPDLLVEIEATATLST
ncbi:chorismatase [Kibdelosporangium phytohabitans]|nr:reactive intermediate/imine deaminase [Kibdelosporangium phytohabitans]MBE1461420.1 chorismatase [Kibdelosporangium phytohabitans]